MATEADTKKVSAEDLGLKVTESKQEKKIGGIVDRPVRHIHKV